MKKSILVVPIISSKLPISVLCILLAVSCVKLKNTDEKIEILLFLLNTGVSHSLKAVCLDWAFSEWECVEDNSSEVSILSECNSDRIMALRESLMFLDQAIDDSYLSDIYRCLLSCNRDYNLSIACPIKLQFSSIAEYRKPREEGSSLFATKWQNCRNQCMSK